MERGFTKKDNKLARELISVAVEREFEIGLGKAGEIISQWQNKDIAVRDAYYKLFEHIKSFDKQISKRYDALKNSDFPLVISVLLNEKIISEEEISDFSEDAKIYIKLWIQNLK
ncbi:MAG TPA: hypothetical protein PLL66_00660 [Bacteroidales bacterium]|nr:hypothetical protein [Bacteroidales bacterium]